MLAAVSPSASCHNETLNTLRFANQAKNIVNDPKVNEVSFDLRKNKQTKGKPSLPSLKNTKLFFTVYFLIAFEDCGTVREHKQQGRRQLREREKSNGSVI